MNSTNNKIFHSHRPWALLFVLLASLVLAACDSVPNEPTTAGINSGGDNVAASYLGPACNANAATADQATVEDICNFQTEFWAKMLTASQCANCHDTQAGDQSPYFLDTANINTAYGQMISNNLVDLINPANSDIIAKINTGHNCGDNATCSDLASAATQYITNWRDGGVAGGGNGSESNEVVLTPPTIKATGVSKNFPGTSANFAGVHNLLVTNCADCHRESSATPQTPFFAEDDIDIAYAAVVASQKVNLETPRDSRLVARMDEGHNCWALDSTVQQAVVESRKDCAVLMEQAVTAFADSITATAVNPAWVTSKAMTLLDGIVASGGARDDSSTIALYEFKTGTGSTITDTSGAGAPLNLELFGVEGTDYQWVGGWGIEFLTNSARAQATTTASRKLLTQILGSGQYSIEAWVVPANITQGNATDPAQIVSYYGSSAERNFTLGQAEYRYAFMNRTSVSADPNGDTLLTDDDDEDLLSTQQHVVLTFDMVEGRKVYVNGVDVSTVGNDAADPSDPLIPAGNLIGWDETYAFIMGNAVDSGEAWAGKLRLVAIHNRAMTPAQISQNFEAGVGQQFILMFSVSEQMGDPACTLDGVHQCFVYFVASQFDSYSYLFTDPTFISLNPAFTPGGTAIKGIRVGMNGREPAAGQAYVNIDTTINGTDYTATGQPLSSIGTIFTLEKGSGADEFFLTFEQLGGNSNVRVPAVCNPISDCMATPADITPAPPTVGLRTFEEILASMAAMTGVDPYLPQFSGVKNTYYDAVNETGIKQQLPTTENADGFLSAHQMAIAQLAIKFCDALVEDAALRDNFFGAGFGFGSDVATAFGAGDSVAKNQIVNALYDKMVGYPDAGNGNKTLDDMPTRAEVKTELIGPDDAGNTEHPGNLFDRLTTLCPTGCDQVRTRAITKALCTATLGSAAMLIQ